MSFIDPLLARIDISGLSTEKRWEALDGHYDRLRKFLMMVAKGKKSLFLEENTSSDTRVEMKQAIQYLFNRVKLNSSNTEISGFQVRTR